MNGLNPAGGFPSETVQLDFPYQIVVAATCRFMFFPAFTHNLGLFKMVLLWKKKRLPV